MTAAKPDVTGSDGDHIDRQRASEIDKRLDRELAETFPASDPPSITSPAASEGAHAGVHRDPKAGQLDKDNAAKEKPSG